MKNFDWTCFTSKTAIKAPIQELYDAWTRADKIEEWFLSKAVNSRNGSILPADENISAGDDYAWNWYLYDSTENGKFTIANGKDHIQFTFAGDCKVDINLKQLDEMVIVELTQSNIPTDDSSKRNIRLGCDTGWSFFLVNLKSIYEGGIDLRNTDEKLKGMLNS